MIPLFSIAFIRSNDNQDLSFIYCLSDHLRMHNIEIRSVKRE